MPAVQQKPSKTDVSYSLSYNIGFVGSDQKVYLNNHLSLLVRYTPASTGFYRIVGVEAMPYSVDYGDLSPLETSCQYLFFLALSFLFHVSQPLRCLGKNVVCFQTRFLHLL